MYKGRGKNMSLRKVMQRIIPEAYRLEFGRRFYRFLWILELIDNPKNFIKNGQTVIYKKCDVRDIFMAQNTNEGFQKYVMIMYFLAIDYYYEKNNYGKDLLNQYYENVRTITNQKGQSPSAEGFNTEYEHLTALIDSFNQTGYNGSRVKLDKNYNLVNGNHRVAIMLYHKHYKIQCEIWNKVWNAGDCLPKEELKLLGISDINITHLVDKYMCVKKMCIDERKKSIHYNGRGKQSVPRGFVSEYYTQRS